MQGGPQHAALSRHRNGIPHGPLHQLEGLLLLALCLQVIPLFLVLAAYATQANYALDVYMAFHAFSLL